MNAKKTSSISVAKLPLGGPPRGANDDREEGVVDARIVELPVGGRAMIAKTGSSMSASSCCPWGRTMIAKRASSMSAPPCCWPVVRILKT